MTLVSVTIFKVLCIDPAIGIKNDDLTRVISQQSLLHSDAVILFRNCFGVLVMLSHPKDVTSWQTTVDQIWCYTQGGPNALSCIRLCTELRPHTWQNSVLRRVATCTVVIFVRPIVDCWRCQGDLSRRTCQGRFGLPVQWHGTLSPNTSGIPTSNSDISRRNWKHTCSVFLTICSALEISHGND